MLDQDFPIEVILDIVLPYPERRPTPLKCRLTRTYEPQTMGLCYLPVKGDVITLGGYEVEITKRKQRSSTVILVASIELLMGQAMTADGRREYYEGVIGYFERANYNKIE